MTPWTALVGPNNALPEYPRPQMARTSWQNLNGLWDYLGRSGVPVLAASPPPGSYRQQILLPYPPESALSGIGRHDDEMWYRRIFQMNGNWQGQQVLLHFGAVDQVATVWVNGRQMARHEGGYTEFSADITPALRPAGPQEIIVRAEDRNEANPFPVGKQRNRPEGLFYTGSSGIWQTVWLEPVPLAHVEKLHITTDLNAVTVVPKTAGTVDERVIVFVSKQAGRVVAVGSGAPGEPIRIPIPAPQLWSPDNPYLYSMKVALVRPSGQVIDVVSSYAGLRTIGTVADRHGRRH
jgi:beta-galactosidase/beta-glucuronidase